MDPPQLAEAEKLLELADRLCDDKAIVALESGIDLLNELAKPESPPDAEVQARLNDLRRGFAQAILKLLPARDRSRRVSEYARVLLLKLQPQATSALLHSRANAMLFPSPRDEAVVDVSPPGLAWQPMSRVFGYRVMIWDQSGRCVYQRETGRQPVHRPDVALDPGRYTWDVIGLDAEGLDCQRRGLHGFSITQTATKLPWVEASKLLRRVPPSHPRFLFDTPLLTTVRSSRETTRAESWARCRSVAESALDVEAPPYPTYHELSDAVAARLEYRAYFERLWKTVDGDLMSLSLAFLVTGDPRYSDPAKRVLMNLVRWPTDDNDVTSVSARWGDEVGLSLAKCMHRSYDWLYDSLSPEDRAAVVAACESRGWQVYRRLIRHDYLSYPGESHNGRLICYLAEMAIVLAGESDGAECWFDYAMTALTTLFPNWGGEQGGWSEGTAYGLWYNEHFRSTLETVRNTTGFDLWKRPVFRKLPYFFFYCTALRSAISPFGDGSENEGPARAGGSAFAGLMKFYAHRLGDAHLGWWAQECVASDGSRDATALIFEDDLPQKPPIDLPNARCFADVGWAALHSDLASPDQDTLLLFKSSPFGSLSHSHADQNAFCLFKGGKALAIPSGYNGPMPGMPHHFGWTQSTKANNSVLVNDNGQAIQDRQARGRIVDFADHEGLCYVSGDATESYRGKLERFERRILMLRPDVLVMLDDLTAASPSQYQWMLHAYEPMDLDHAAMRVLLENQGASLDIRLRSSSGLTIRQTDQFDISYNEGVPTKYHVKMPDQWHLTAETQRRETSVRIGAIMIVSGPGETNEIELLQHPGWFGARVTGAQGTVEGWCQIDKMSGGPSGYGESVQNGTSVICGTPAVGTTFCR